MQIDAWANSIALSVNNHGLHRSLETAISGEPLPVVAFVNILPAETRQPDGRS